jgi:chitodextrinase
MFLRITGLTLGAILLAVTFGASTAGARRDRQPPTTPTNLRITATTQTTVTLAWNASTDNSGNFSYRVVHISPFNTYEVGLPQTQTTLTVRNLWPQTTYSFRVYAIDAASNRSGNSNTVSHTPPPDTVPPSPAPQLTVNPFSPARASFSWSRSTDDVSQVQYSLYVNGVLRFSQFSYEWATIWDLTPSATYDFQVIASDVFGNSVEGNTVTVTMPSTTDTTPPSPPTNLAGTMIENEIHMTWTQSTDNSDPQSQIIYEFYLNDDIHSSDDNLFGSSGLAYCREASGLTTVVARAMDSSGNRSAPSNEIVVQCP